MRLSLISILVCAVVLQSCNSTRLASCEQLTVATDKNYYQQKIFAGPFSIETLFQPGRCKANQASVKSGMDKNPQELFFRIRITNLADMSSPLRKVCTSLDQYSAANEYLLNNASKDISLECGNAQCLPIGFWFENNYNGAPFETLKIGFSLPATFFKDKNQTVRLVFVDKVFSGDTLRFHYPASIIKKEAHKA